MTADRTPQGTPLQYLSDLAWRPTQPDVAGWWIFDEGPALVHSPARYGLHYLGPADFPFTHIGKRQGWRCAPIPSPGEYERGWREAAEAIEEACIAKEREHRAALLTPDDRDNCAKVFVEVWARAGALAQAISAGGDAPDSTAACVLAYDRGRREALEEAAALAEREALAWEAAGQYVKTAAYRMVRDALRAIAPAAGPFVFEHREEATIIDEPVGTLEPATVADEAALRREAARQLVRGKPDLPPMRELPVGHPGERG